MPPMLPTPPAGPCRRHVQAFPARIIAMRRRGLDEPRANVGDESEGTVEFLVNIEVDWPADGDPDELARLTAAERARGAELAAAGTIRRMWRVPGRRANQGVASRSRSATASCTADDAARSASSWAERESGAHHSMQLVKIVTESVSLRSDCTPAEVKI